MRLRSTSRQGRRLAGWALAAACLFLAPTVLGTFVVVSPEPRTFTDADLQGGNYFAVAAGSSDTTTSDLVVTTVALCDPAVGCHRDVRYRFMNTPSKAPTANDVAADADAALAACDPAHLASVPTPTVPPAPTLSTPPAPGPAPAPTTAAVVAWATAFRTAAEAWQATTAADVTGFAFLARNAATDFANATVLWSRNFAQNCGDAGMRRTFADLPVATTALDESNVFTDGRFIVYSVASPGGQRDVYRFDARNPHLAAVPVAATAADEFPFGVGGDWVGIRTVLADGTHQLSAVNLGEPPVWGYTLGKPVNATDPATLSSKRVAWATGPTLFHQTLQKARGIAVPTHYLWAGEASYRSIALWNERLAFVRSMPCNAGASDCNDVSYSPPRSAIAGVLVFKPLDAANPHGAAVHSGTDLMVFPTILTTQRCAGNQPASVSAARVATVDPVAAEVYHDAVFVRVRNHARTASCELVAGPDAVTESLLLFERARVAPQANGNVIPTGVPAAWTGRAPGELGEAAVSNRYVFLLDYAPPRPALDAYAWAHCYEAYPGTANTIANHGPPPKAGPLTTRCMGGGPLSPGGPLGPNSN